MHAPRPGGLTRNAGERRWIWSFDRAFSQRKRCTLFVQCYIVCVSNSANTMESNNMISELFSVGSKVRFTKANRWSRGEVVSATDGWRSIRSGKGDETTCAVETLMTDEAFAAWAAVYSCPKALQAMTLEEACGLSGVSSATYAAIRQLEGGPARGLNKFWSKLPVAARTEIVAIKNVGRSEGAAMVADGELTADAAGQIERAASGAGLGQAAVSIGSGARKGRKSVRHFSENGFVLLRGLGDRILSITLRLGGADFTTHVAGEAYGASLAQSVSEVLAGLKAV
jgi:hypothetical protein